MNHGRRPARSIPRVSAGFKVTSDGPRLPADRAFVVQLRPEARVEPGCLAGRVEHVVSGDASQFDSLDGLLRFLAHALTSVRDRESANAVDEED